MAKVFLILTSLLLVSCASLKESPVIYFSNASNAPIKNIQCTWAEKNVLSLPVLNPGDSRSLSFYIRGDSAFFGLINVSWDNGHGEKMTKSFFFRKENMPSIFDPTTYNYVQLYFDQFDVEVVSSDAPDLGGKVRRMERLLAHYSSEYKNVAGSVPQTSLISIQPKKDNTLPGWLSNSY